MVLLAIGHGTAPTSGTLPVAQAITVSCQGQIPKGVIVVATRATSLSAVTSGAMASVAVSDGTTTRLGSAMSENGQLGAAADTGIDYDNGAQIIRILSTGDETTDGLAEFVSFAADTVNIQWTDLPTDAVRFVVFALYGAHVACRAAAVNINTSGADTSVTVSGTAFRPKGLFHLGARAGFTSSGANADMHFGFAALNDDGTVQGQAGYCLREGDRPGAATVCHSGIRDDSTGQRITTTAEECRAEVTAGTADGFTITTRVAGGFAYSFGFLAFTCPGRVSVGAVQPTTSSAGNKTITGLLGRPAAVFMLGTALGSVNAYSTTAPCANWSLGAGVLPGPGVSAVVNGCIGYMATDNAITSSTSCVTENAQLAHVPADTSGTDWTATLVSGAAGEFVINVGSASAADRYLAWMALEATPDVGWLSEARSGSRWRRQLARM